MLWYLLWRKMILSKSVNSGLRVTNTFCLMSFTVLRVMSRTGHKTMSLSRSKAEVELVSLDHRNSSATTSCIEGIRRKRTKRWGSWSLEDDTRSALGPRSEILDLGDCQHLGRGACSSAKIWGASLFIVENDL
jgi:hypothetical protein